MATTPSVKSRALAEGRAQSIFDTMVELGARQLERLDADRAETEGTR